MDGPLTPSSWPRSADHSGVPAGGSGRVLDDNGELLLTSARAARAPMNGVRPCRRRSVRAPAAQRYDRCGHSGQAASIALEEQAEREQRLVHPAHTLVADGVGDDERELREGRVRREQLGGRRSGAPYALAPRAYQGRRTRCWRRRSPARRSSCVVRRGRPAPCRRSGCRRPRARRARQQRCPRQPRPCRRAA